MINNGVRWNFTGIFYLSNTAWALGNGKKRCVCSIPFLGVIFPLLLRPPFYFGQVESELILSIHFPLLAPSPVIL